MEQKTDIFLGYKEFRTEHYNKWEKSQSKRYFEYRKKWIENAQNLVLEEFPLHLDIAITNVCNLECTFCARTVRVEEGTWRKAQHMSLELFKKIIDEAVELGTYSINLNLLNEPLIHPKLIEMVRYAKDKGIIDVFFHSHGGLLTGDKAEKLLESGLDRLLISIDSPYKEKYNKIRVLSDFDLVMNNLKQFKKMRDEKGLLSPVIRVSIIQFPDVSHKEIRDAKELFLQYADAIGFQQYVDPRKEIGKDKKYIDGYKSEFVCHQPFTRLSIIEDGRVSPCCLDYDQQLVIGDISKQSLKSIWKSIKLNKIRETLKKGEFYKIPACATCERAIDADQGIHMSNENTEPTA
ncbi:MAG: radical SAM protein [Nitrosopumilus sp.]|nr:radical SAM protein [Nitrosopumilus sp.]